MNSAQVASIFKQTEALLTGHFLLTSGLHSEKYLQCARVLQWPEHAGACGRALAQYYTGTRTDLVISPAIGGIIIGHEVARALGCRAIFAERENGALRLRRGFKIVPRERVLVVEDVVTTGGSTLETMEVVKAQGGIVLGVASLVDRSGGQVCLRVVHHTLWSLSVPTYKVEDCPLCKSGSQPIKPGSRS